MLPKRKQIPPIVTIKMPAVPLPDVFPLELDVSSAKLNFPISGFVLLIIKFLVIYIKLIVSNG
jgi:hypothetical protein